MPLRILLIDDNPDDRTLVVREINKVLTNAIVDEIGDALDFEATMTSGREWDVAVTDYQLGWSTGLHVFHRLRSQWPELPVIMFTASGNEDIAVAALKDGLDDYITKTAVHYGRIPYAVRACGERRRRRREAQDATSALRRNEAILQLALDAAHMEVWEHDLDTRKTLLHGRAEHVFGGQRRELSREQLFELLHPDDRERVRAEFLAATSGVARFDAEFRVVPDGEERWLRAAATIDDVQRGHRVVGVVEDITKRKRLEAELREADRQKDQFIATLAHELRNPLAPIRYAAQLLRVGATETSIARVRDVIERQSALMARLLDDLLDISRIALNRIELRRERIDLRSVAEQVAQDVRPLVENAGHTLIFNTTRHALWVDGDTIRLHEIADNLLQNAIKFTPRGGRITLEIDRDGDYGVLRVCDNGIGIAREMLDRVFETFVQINAGPASSTPGGLGIGLAVVKKLVALHGGSVRAYSAGAGQGAEFVVKLPLVEGPVTIANTHDVTEQTVDPHKPRVLIADDQPDAAESLALVLKLNGHAVSVALDGAQAQSLAESERPEVMVLDIGMPRANGDEVARWVREQPWGTQIKLVAVTGWGREEDRQRTKDAGFDMHLVKPVDVDELMRAINSSASLL